MIPGIVAAQQMIAAPAGGGPTDPHFANVVLLCGFEGANGSTVIVDESAAAHALTALNGAAIDTAQFKFGASSLAELTTSDTVSSPDSADWHLAAGASDEFTIETFVRRNSTGLAHILQQWNGTGNQQSFILQFTSSDKLKFFWSDDGIAGHSIEDTVNVVGTGAWHHVAVDRASDATMRLYLDGTMVASSAANTTLFDSNDSLFIGSFRGTSAYLRGWLDEVRITKGVARYKGNFTVPAAAFPRS